MYNAVIFCCLGVLLSFQLRAQNPDPGFTIVGNPQQVDVSSYVSALQTVDMTRYRYADKPMTLRFSTGVVVTLHSADQLEAAGQTVDRTLLRSTDPRVSDEASFVLTTSGYLVEQLSVPARK